MREASNTVGNWNAFDECLIWTNSTEKVHNKHCPDRLSFFFVAIFHGVNNNEYKYICLDK